MSISIECMICLRAAEGPSCRMRGIACHERPDSGVDSWLYIDFDVACNSLAFLGYYLLFTAM